MGQKPGESDSDYLMRLFVVGPLILSIASGAIVVLDLVNKHGGTFSATMAAGIMLCVAAIVWLYWPRQVKG